MSCSRHFDPNRRRPIARPFALLLALALLAPALIAAPARAATAGPGDADPALYESVLPFLRDAIYAETGGNLSRFAIDATFTPATETTLATIAGRVDLRYVNNTADPLTELYFRLYPNAEEYGDGAMTIDRAAAGDAELPVALSVADTLATVRLPRTLLVGEAIDLELTFTSTIPTDPARSYGMYSFDRETGSYALAHWLPLLAGYDPVNGWELGPPSAQGDPVFTNTALFDVTITAPKAFVFVTTGNEVESSTTGDTVTRRFVSGPVRDFVMAADDDFLVERIAVGETTVNSYFNPGSEEGGISVLTAGAQALETYNRLFGAYPYSELDLVEIDLGNGAGGVEFPQIVFIGHDYYGQGGPAQAIPGYLEFIVAHEVAHQWWYGLVGNNQYRHAFMDEALANHVTTVYFAEVYGEDVGDQQVAYNLKAAYFSVLFNGGDAVVDQPTDDFPSQRAYGAIVYGKGALAFGAIQNEIGAEAFFTGLQSYYRQFAFQIAAPDDLKAAFEEASGQDLDELWRHWFNAAEGDQDYDASDLARLLREIGR